jgi:hypothetical protein
MFVLLNWYTTMHSQQNIKYVQYIADGIKVFDAYKILDLLTMEFLSLLIGQSRPYSMWAVRRMFPAWQNTITSENIRNNTSEKFSAPMSSDVSSCCPLVEAIFLSPFQETCLWSYILFYQNYEMSHKARTTCSVCEITKYMLQFLRLS